MGGGRGRPLFSAAHMATDARRGRSRCRFPGSRFAGVIHWVEKGSPGVASPSRPRTGGWKNPVGITQAASTTLPAAVDVVTAHAKKADCLL